MTQVELIEFLARFAHLLFAQERLPSLTAKLSKLFSLLFPIAGQKFVPADQDDDIDSGSDFDDDVIDDIIQEKFGRK